VVDQPAPAAIEVRGLRKSYEGVERVHAIDFSVAPGEIFGLLGTNGAGKTTTIEILEGYRSRDHGEARVLGTDPSHPTRAWRERIGIVLQESELDPLYTVRETVSQFGRYFAERADVDATLARVGLRAKADERIGRLSGGQKRAVDVALGLIGRPELLFLDEPTTGLDPAARREMWATIAQLRDAGTTVLLTTHYMDEAQHLADRLVILRAGDVVGAGTPAELTAGQGDTAVVTFTLDRPGDLAGAVTLSATPSLDDGVVRLVSSAPQRDLFELLRWADRASVELHGLEVDRPSLDDIFLRLTGADEEGTDQTVGPAVDLDTDPATGLAVGPATNEVVDPAAGQTEAGS
jgi:ABC-2 type transport system ATP-binding protein